MLSRNVDREVAFSLGYRMVTPQCTYLVIYHVLTCVTVRISSYNNKLSLVTVKDALDFRVYKTDLLIFLKLISQTILNVTVVILHSDVIYHKHNILHSFVGKF